MLSLCSTFWRFLWSITIQTHGSMESFLLFLMIKNVNRCWWWRHLCVYSPTYLKQEPIRCIKIAYVTHPLVELPISLNHMHKGFVPIIHMKHDMSQLMIRNLQPVTDQWKWYWSLHMSFIWLTTLALSAWGRKTDSVQRWHLERQSPEMRWWENVWKCFFF